ncbi:MAG: hypothetical protein HY270_06980 [Deltaproteobacteria bacterium]|nr:hypothetical protein [Deltaproteobacteria bacterium]
MRRFFYAPIDDYLKALDNCLSPFRVGYLLLIIGAFALAWWIYVPIHELLHAFGCWGTGGSVTRLEIDAMYGAVWLQRWFPFVAVGSQYAGQLTGFDTHDNDLIYLATDAAPFVLTILPGVPLLRAAALPRQSKLGACLLLGASMPIAYAPFISFTGDYYEMGSILVSRAVWLAGDGFDVARWRSDDVFKLAGSIRTTAGVGDWMGIAASLVVGAAMAFVTYAAGRWIYKKFGRVKS